MIRLRPHSPGTEWGTARDGTAGEFEPSRVRYATAEGAVHPVAFRAKSESARTLVGALVLPGGTRAVPARPHSPGAGPAGARSCGAEALKRRQEMVDLRPARRLHTSEHGEDPSPARDRTWRS